MGRKKLTADDVVADVPEAPPPAAPAAAGPGLLDRIKSIGQGALGAAEAFGDNFNQNFAFGLPARAMEALGAYPDRAQLEQLHQDHPDASLLGRATGLTASAVAGPEAAVGRAAQGAMGAAQQAAPFLANSIGGRILAQGGAGALAGAGSEAARATVQGQPALPAAANGLMFGGLGGLAMGSAGEAATGTANAIRGSKGGEARRTIEAAGGEVGPFTSGKGGPFDAELKGMPANDRGIGMVSRQRAEKILGQVEDEHLANTVKPAGIEKEAIANSLAGQRKVDATRVYSDLVRLSRSQRLTPSEVSQVDGVLNKMDKLIELRGSVEMTQAELNDFKGMLQDLSKVGATGVPSVAQSKLQDVARTTREMVDQGPYADVNARTHKGIQKYERQRALLDVPERPSGRETIEGVPESEVARLGNALARQEQNTVTAGVRNSDRYSQFADENPQFAHDLSLPDVLRAKADLGFHAGSKGHGGLINRMPPGLALGASGAMAMMTHGSPISALPIAAEFAAHNLPAIAGRYAYGPAMNAEAALSPIQLRPGAPTQSRMIGAAPGIIPASIQSLIEEYRAAMERMKHQGDQQ